MASPPQKSCSIDLFEAKDGEFQVLRRQCKRFRVLVMGRANAGKTTILERMCQSTEPPIVKDQEGRTIPTADWEKSGRERGNHEITYEITFKSNPGFVFHDSCGFEAGSAQELKIVQDFIAKRIQAKNLEFQLHAIWFCIPTNEDRPLIPSELQFFEEVSPGVPVVVIYTKFDSQRSKVIAELQREGCTYAEARKGAPARMEALLPELKTRLKETAHPPAAVLSLKNMQKADADCGELTKMTADALTNESLLQLFVTVQRNNLQTSVKCCVQKAVDAGFIGGTSYSLDKTVRLVYGWFPHCNVRLHSQT